MNSFPAGGDGFSLLTQGTSDVVGVPDLDALVAHLGATRPTAPPATDRITMG